MLRRLVRRLAPAPPRRMAASAAEATSTAVTVGYASDVEGDLPYWERFVDHSKVLSRDPTTGALTLRDNSMFVFGGDVCDRGSGDLRILADLVGLKERHPDRVFFILGNRDINKLRLPFSLHQSVLQKCTPAVYWLRNEHDRTAAERDVIKGCRTSKLHWILGKTMGAPLAFEMRRQELLRAQASAVSDDAVTASFVDSLDPEGGVLLKFLQLAQVGLVLGDVLFVHGAVHDYNHGWVPTDKRVAGANETSRADVQSWVEAINAFARREVQDFVDHQAAHLNALERADDPGQLLWEPTGGYDHPQPGSRLLQYGMGWAADRSKNPSPVYSSYLVAGTQVPIGEQAARWLTQSGIQRVVVGHQPLGDAPWTLDRHGVQTISADTAYSRNVQWPRDHLRRVLGASSSARPSASLNESVSVHDFLAQAGTSTDAAVAADHSTTRSGLTVSEVLLTLGGPASELTLHGVLSDGSTYNFTVPPSSENNVIGRTLPGGWIVKASNVRLPTRSATDEAGESFYLAGSNESHVFRNKLLSEAELRHELQRGDCTASLA